MHNSLRHLSLAALAAALMTQSANAANAVWNGTTDATWSTPTNWSAPVPGVGDTAFFSNAGNGNVVIDVGTISLTTINFDNAAVAAYTLGDGTDSITFADGTTTGVTMSATVNNNQVVNANLTLGTAIASNTSFVNNDLGSLLTLGGTITGGTGGVAAAKTVSFSGAGNTTVGGIISDGGATSVALTKVAGGVGTLTLSAANTYTGLTTVSGGTLAYGINDAIASGAVTVTAGTLAIGAFSDTVGTVTLSGGSITGSGGTLTSTSDFVMNAGAATSVSAILGGSVGLTKTANGQLTLSGSNTYTGITAINGGSILMTNANALGTTAAGTTVAAGSTLFLQNNIAVGAEALDLTGNGAGNNGALQSSSGNNSWGGNITVAAGTRISNTAAGTTLTIGGGINSTNQSTTLGRSGANGNITVNGALSLGNGGIAKEGTGTLTLNSANTFSGATGITAGTVVAGANGAFGTSSGITLGHSTQTVVGDAPTLLIGGAFTVDRAITFGSTGAVAYNTTLGGSNTSGTSTFTGNIAVNTGANTATLQAATGGTVEFKTGTWTNTGNKAIAVGSVGNTGTVLLSNNLAGSGGVSVNAGTLLVSNASGSGLGTGNATVNTGGTLGGSGSFTGTVTVNAGGTLAPGASIESLGSGALTLNNNSTFAYEVDSGVATSVGADLQVASGNLTLTGTANLTLANIDLTPITFADNTTFTLINYNGTWNNGLFTYNSTVLNDDSQFSFNGQTWQINYNAATGGLNFPGNYLGGADSFVNITVIPEPATFALLAFGMTTVMLLRRRRS